MATEEEEDERELGDTWTQWFCSLEGHEYLVEVDADYIQDRFNLFGLKPHIPNYDNALAMILDGDYYSGRDMSSGRYSEIYRDAQDLYGLIHARFILSPRGLVMMRDRYMEGYFGKCPRVLCDRQNTLPVGITSELDEFNVRLYCPKCQEIYDFAKKNSYQVDGAYFGPSFPHIFLQTYPSVVPLDCPIYYQPKIFGFRIHTVKSIVQIKLEMGEYGDSVVAETRGKKSSDENSEVKETSIVKSCRKQKNISARIKPNEHAINT